MMMLFNPVTEGDFVEVLNGIGRRDAKVVVVGRSLSLPESADFLKDSGHEVYVEAAHLTPQLLRLYTAKTGSPARHEYCRHLLVNKAGARLPRPKKYSQIAFHGIAGVNQPREGASA